MTFTVSAANRGRGCRVEHPDGRHLITRTRTEAEQVARLLLGHHIRRAEKNDALRENVFPLRITRGDTDYELRRGDFHVKVQHSELVPLANMLVDIAEGSAAPEEL
ncbi:MULTISPECIES: hypothetical protein [Tsukamurella]|uniref:Uncharacterized protein n=2 Tax=Tsukamurella TaxID=2060 RepID=A0A5C5RWD9_9ACTN|nr:MULTISPECIES: hypothetical protein [Tsukamurella]NMD55566.1 hypothetical protein [Tsukamurella columbiensis]TWS27327.1 hypothetical protein FK530_19480 [Tsukamurella conjunctivitidis]